MSAAAASARQLLNPLASTSQVELTPSRQDGISEELERDLRACELLPAIRGACFQPSQSS